MGKKSVILVVDDHVENIELLEAFLAPFNYEIITASNGEDALKIVFNNRGIDLVLLDVMMTGINGFEVTSRIRESEIGRILPIVLVTSLHEKQDRVKGIEAGCDDFITKPVDKIELLARVRSLLKVKAYNDLLFNYRKDLEIEVKERTHDLGEALKKVKLSSLDTIYRLSVASEYKDEDTGFHIKRMSLYSAAIARRLGLGKNIVDTILYASPMHDVGKIGIPDRILMKPGKLDEDEWVVMKKHTTFGANILKGSDAEFIVLGESIALNHHEKWDGTGYPNGIAGEVIPIAARITAVADVFDALTTRRPYKEPFSIDKSIGIIIEERGTHFDPAVVHAFIAIKDEIVDIKNKFENKIG